VQKRLLKVRKFAFFLLWGRFKGILVGLDREDNYKEPDNRYRFRRVFFFAKHPNHLMYQAKGNDVLKRHDLITEAAAEMAGESDLAQANFYCNKLWKKTDPRRQAILKEARSRGLQFSRQMLSTAVPPSSSSALDKTPQLDWDYFFHGQQTHSNKLLFEEILPGALAVWQEEREENQLYWNSPSDFPTPILRWIQGSRHALFDSASVPESAEKIISALHRLAFPNQKSVTRQPLHEIIRVLLESQNDCVQEARKNRNAHLLHSGVGQSLQLSCPKCGREHKDNNPQWAVKWPGHYHSVRQICKSELCDGSRKNFYPKDWEVLRTPSRVILNSEEFDAQYALRSCLRKKGECSELPDVIKSWCLTCKENTRINGNHRVVVDHNPQWTLGDNPLYLEKRPECQSCFDSGSRLSGRFVPVDEEVTSIMPRIVSDLANSIVDLDRYVRWLVMDSVLRASERKYRFAEK